MTPTQIVTQAWQTYPEDRASRMVYMTANGMRAGEARMYAEGGPCKKGQTAARSGCTPAQKGKNAPGKGGAFHGPAKPPGTKSATPRPSKTQLDRKKAEAGHAAEDAAEKKPAAKKRAPSQAQKEKAEDREDAKQRKRQAKAKADSDFKTGGAKGRERARDEAIAKRRDPPAAGKPNPTISLPAKDQDYTKRESMDDRRSRIASEESVRAWEKANPDWKEKEFARMDRAR